jgi:hypothetical protein
MNISLLLALSLSAGMVLTPQVRAALPVPIQAQLPVGAGTCAESIAVTNTNGAPLGALPLPDPECGPFQGGDVWVSLLAPESGELVVGGGYSDFGLTRMAFYAWRKAQLVPLTCAWPHTLHEVPETRLSGLNAGELILVRIWDAANNQKGEAWLCAYDPEARPEPGPQVASPVAPPMERSEVPGAAVLYPNPASDFTSLSWTGGIDLPGSLQVVDAQGRLWSVPLSPGGNGLQADLRNLPEGWYWLRMRSGDAWVDKALRVQR